MSVEGTWDLSISALIGTIRAVIELRRDDGVLTGAAHGAGEEVPLDDIVLDGDRLTGKQAITKPLRLNLAFAVTVDGDTLTGTSKAGRLPVSKVTDSAAPSERSQSTDRDESPPPPCTPWPSARTPSPRTCRDAGRSVSASQNG
jgi:hypothetical protein